MKRRKPYIRETIEDYYIQPKTDFVLPEDAEPLIDYNKYYWKHGFGYKTDLDREVWLTFLRAPANPAEQWMKEHVAEEYKDIAFTDTKDIYSDLITHITSDEDTFPETTMSEYYYYGGITSMLYTDRGNVDKLYTKAVEDAKKADKFFKHNLVDELSEMWLWGDLNKRAKFSFYENYTSMENSVNIPYYLLSANKYAEPSIYSLSKIEIVALSFITQYTFSNPETGYIECSGHIEKATRCSVNEAHAAIISLFKKGFLLDPFFPPHEFIYNLYRCASWKLNLICLKDFASRYNISLR